MDNIVEIKHLNFGYESSRLILSDVNLEIKAGESCCIVGPNGGGKSTLLRLLLGLISPNSGTLRIFGEEPQKSRGKIGYMPQYHQLDPAFPVTAFEVALMGRMRRNFCLRYSKADRDIAMDSLNELKIANLSNMSFASLSGGQRQRVLIARALACRPELLLLDEPTANIDPGAEGDFYDTLDRLRKRMTILTVSHDLGFVNKEIDKVICVNREVSIHNAGSLDDEAIHQVYHHHVNLIKHDHSCFCNCQKES